jgi:hypothetical protein
MGSADGCHFSHLPPKSFHFAILGLNTFEGTLPKEESVKKILIRRSFTAKIASGAKHSFS